MAAKLFPKVVLFGASIVQVRYNNLFEISLTSCSHLTTQFSLVNSDRYLLNLLVFYGVFIKYNCVECSMSLINKLNMLFPRQQESFSDGGWGAAIADHYQRSVFV